MDVTKLAGERVALRRAPLRVGPVDDPLEREAEAIADRVMRMPSPEVGLIQRCPGGCPDGEMLRRQPIEEEEEEEEVVQRHPVEAASKRRGSNPGGITPEIESTIRARRGGGSPLPEPARRFFEPRFRADFDGLPIHNDATAASLARSVNARAFTLGREIYFGTGEWAPGTEWGDRLIAHELTHTIQRLGGMPGAAEPGLLDGTYQQGGASWVRLTLARNYPEGRGNDPNAHGSPGGGRAIQRLATGSASLAPPGEPRQQMLDRAQELAHQLLGQSLLVLNRQQKAVSAHAQTHKLKGEDEVGWPVLSDWYGAAMHRRLGLEPGRVGFWIDKASMASVDRIETAEDVKQKLIAVLSSKSGKVTYDFTHRGCGKHSIAFVRHGIDEVHLCRPFWKAKTGDNDRALTLIHEWAHLAKGFGDFDEGFGKDNAYCVEKFVADLNEIDSSKPKEANTSSICGSPP